MRETKKARIERLRKELNNKYKIINELDIRFICKNFNCFEDVINENDNSHEIEVNQQLKQQIFFNKNYTYNLNVLNSKFNLRKNQRVNDLKKYHEILFKFLKSIQPHYNLKCKFQLLGFKRLVNPFIQVIIPIYNIIFLNDNNQDIIDFQYSYYNGVIFDSDKDNFFKISNLYTDTSYYL